jgi:hypothetical protein
VLGEPQFLEAALEEFPREEPSILLAALRRGLITAEEDVASGFRYADRPCELPETVPPVIQTRYH